MHYLLAVPEDGPPGVGSAVPQPGAPLLRRERVPGQVAVQELARAERRAVPPRDDEGVEDGARVVDGERRHRRRRAQRQGEPEGQANG